MMYPFFQELYPRFCAKKARIEGSFLLATNKNLELVFLNETAMCFLIKADGITTTGDIVQMMLKEYDVCEQKLANDICVLIRDLQWKNLIVFSKKPNRKLPMFFNVCSRTH